MENHNNNKNTFKIGLCMAGAISAGAYTAGVVDYLLEALEEWEKRKSNNIANTPSHKVELSVMGGASAGGMTSIITAAALQEELNPVKEAAVNLNADIQNNRLYHSWVDLVQKEMLPVLLNTNDIAASNLESLLNSNFIDQLARRATFVPDVFVKPKPYIAKNLKVFVTVSNLQGVQQKTHFISNAQKFSKHIHTNHKDYVCFQLCHDASEYEGQGWIPVNFKKRINVDLAQRAAMATGAFPVGLKARFISRNSKYLNENPWFNYITQSPENPFETSPYQSLNVDGGLINNEPFEKVKAALFSELKRNEGFNVKNADLDKKMKNFNEFTSSIIMIDPFPSEPTEFDKSTQLKSIISNTLSALIGQARVKPEEIEKALNNKNAAQFLIAPVREVNETKIEGSKAIACGALGGFGGFIDKEFRIHDFFLGRANCEQFLREHFTVPANHTNEIFINGYANLENPNDYKSKKGDFQIIPIFTAKKDNPYMPLFSNGKVWPTIPNNKIKSYRKLIKKRVEKILLNMSDYSTKEKALLWIGGKIVINGKVADALINKIEEDLSKRNQM